MPNLTALVYDALLLPSEWTGLRRLRRRLLAQASGRVLEIGVGTGLSLPHYPPIQALVGIEPSSAYLAKAKRRRAPVSAALSLVQADSQTLPFADSAFDMVIGSLVFCTVPDPLQALVEARRVTRPGGRLWLLEHVRGPGEAVGRLQDLVTPVWKRFANGCHLNRRTLATVQDAGWEVTGVTRHLLAGMNVQLIAGRNSP